LCLIRCVHINSHPFFAFCLVCRLVCLVLCFELCIRINSHSFHPVLIHCIAPETMTLCVLFSVSSHLFSLCIVLCIHINSHPFHPVLIHCIAPQTVTPCVLLIRCIAPQTMTPRVLSCLVSLVLYVRQIPLKMLHPYNPPNPETQISQYKFNFNQNLSI